MKNFDPKKWYKLNAKRLCAQGRKRYLANREKKLAQNKLWRSRNKDRVRSYSLKTNEQSRDKLKAYRAAWYLANKEKKNRQSRENYSKRIKTIKSSPDEYKNHLEKIRRRSKEWRNKNPDRFRAHLRKSGRKRYAERKLGLHPEEHIAQAMRSRLRAALKERKFPKQKITNLTSCSRGELIRHLESRFQAGMTWKNYGNWHIDHKRPCASFNLLESDQVKACFHFTNLQPLWATDNLRKGRRIEMEHTAHAAP